MPRGDGYIVSTMYYFLLAFRCFFAVLFAHRLPAEAYKLLPAKAEPEQKVQPISEGDLVVRPAQQEARPAPVPAIPVPEPPPPVAAQQPEPAPTDDRALARQGAIQLLSILQREGRLVDFLMEDVDDYSDAQIGAAVRDIHRGCRKGLVEHIRIAPVRPEPDEAAVRIEEGYNPSRVRLIGTISGRPPFHGTLRHHGWAAEQVTLPEVPANTKNYDPLVITPAEVELGG